MVVVKVLIRSLAVLVSIYWLVWGFVFKLWVYCFFSVCFAIGGYRIFCRVNEFSWVGLYWLVGRCGPRFEVLRVLVVACD